MNRNFAYNVALAEWRGKIAEHGAEAMRRKLDDMIFSVGWKRHEIEALRQALSEEGEDELES